MAPTAAKQPLIDHPSALEDPRHARTVGDTQGCSVLIR